MSSNNEPSDPANPKDNLDPENPDSDLSHTDDSEASDSPTDAASVDDAAKPAPDADSAEVSADSPAVIKGRVLSNTERREAAKRKLRDRLEAEQRARKRRKIIIASVSAAVVVAIAGTITYFVVDKIQTDNFNAAHKDCTYTDKSNELKTVPVEPPAQVQPSQRALYQRYQEQTNKAVRLGQNLKRNSAKPSDKQLKSGTVQAVFTTNQGAIPVTLDRASAPCNTGAVVTLIDHKFYDGTPCHRLTSNGIKVLQCGDPTGTGQSGPGWASPDEPPTNLQSTGQPDMYGGAGPVIYPRGTIAIANSNSGGQASNTGSSQFFFVIQDSQLSADYSVVGKVDEPGLAVLDKIAKGGIIPGPLGQADDGSPKLPVQIQTATTK